MDFTSKRFTFWVHVIFWTCYLLLSTGFYISMKGFNVTLKILVTTLLHANLAYLNLLIFIPKFFVKRKFYLYFLIYIPFYVGTIFTLALYEAWFIDNAPIAFNNIFSATISTSVVVTMIAMLKFLQEWYIQQEKAREMAFGQLEAEHKMLRMQVNPHFLFNALNNIYYLAYKKSDATAPAILKLSDLMRFLLYESDGKKISLQKEIEYIQNYIGLQKLKLSDSKDKVSLEIEGTTNWEIAPLMMIPFIENAFKHGNIEDDDAFLKIKISTVKGRFNFIMSNSFDPNNTKKDEVGGVGIQNVKSRLEVYYANKHNLNIKQTNNIYTVDLSIQIL